MAEMSDGIVAGYDGSPGSEQALQWAVREARTRRTVLTICLAWAPADLAAISEASVDDLAQRRGEEILEHGVAYATGMLGSSAVRPVLARGSASNALCERSGTAEMVVIGARGRGGVAGLKTGSVAWQVSVHGHGPVVMVRGQWHIADHAPGPVAVGVDGSPASQAAVAFAFGEAALHDVPLLAVCALADAPGALGGARELEAEFSHAMIVCEREHPDVTVRRQVAQGSPRTALLDAAVEAQLLVVGCRGRGGVPGMNLGSVAQAMLHYAPCPVGVIHPRADPQLSPKVTANLGYTRPERQMVAGRRRASARLSRHGRRRAADRARWTVPEVRQAGRAPDVLRAGRRAAGKGRPLHHRAVRIPAQKACS